MNLVYNGAHAATDWLTQLLRRHEQSGPVEVHVMVEGTLHWRFFRRDAAPRRFGKPVGVFTHKGMPRPDMRAMFQMVRGELVNGVAA